MTCCGCLIIDTALTMNDNIFPCTEALLCVLCYQEDGSRRVCFTRKRVLVLSSRLYSLWVGEAMVELRSPI